MLRRRAFLLLEVIVGLALLGLLAVWLIKIQSATLRQCRETRLRERIVCDLNALLWEWSSAEVSVTLPATGQFSDSLQWRRSALPVRVANGLLVSQVTVTVSETDVNGNSREKCRVDWLVPRKPPVAERP